MIAGKSKKELLKEAIAKLSATYCLEKSNRACELYLRKAENRKKNKKELEIWDSSVQDGLST